MQTCTLISDTSTSLRLRVDRTWKGRIFFFSLSQATASLSNTMLLIPGFRAPCTRCTMSGYLPVLFSAFLLKIMTDPSSSTCIWARSPSYLYSHVNSMSWNFSSTSPTALVALANMGLTGTPRVNWQCCSSSCRGCCSRAGIITSYEGQVLNATLTMRAASSSFSASWGSRGLSSPRCSSTACPRATSTLCSASPMRSLACSERIT
mmetsp:Transcript_25442/g.55246  ORF Transcript_25442/g.55246 Transcript_25442/m.55246 type:complete len:206 (-) Transcript_25442:1684-2301(-)